MKVIKINNSVVVLLSGGPDSAVAAHYYHDNGYKVHCLTVVNKQRGSNCIEVDCAKLIASEINAPHTLIDLSCLTEVFKDISDMKFAVGGDAGGCAPPKINTAPLSVESMHMTAMMYAVSHKIETVIWSLHLDDLGMESTYEIQKYLSILKRLVYLRTKRLCKIETPFLSTRKAEVLMLGHKLGLDFRQTFSCAVNEEAIHCGECNQCLGRIDAFKKARIVDPAHFSSYEIALAV